MPFLRPWVGIRAVSYSPSRVLLSHSIQFPALSARDILKPLKCQQETPFYAPVGCIHYRPVLSSFPLHPGRAFPGSSQHPLSVFAHLTSDNSIAVSLAKKHIEQNIHPFWEEWEGRHRTNTVPLMESKLPCKTLFELSNFMAIPP